MKTVRLIAFWAVLAAAAGGLLRAEDGAVEKAPEFRGVLADGAGKTFGLFVPATGQTGWATVGQTLGGWKLKEYRAADDTLVLTKDGREEILHLSESVIAGYHKGSQADAAALVKAMKLRERIDKEISKNMTDTLKQLLAGAGLANPTPEQLSEFQKIFAGIFDPARMADKMAETMGEVYTEEELKAQTGFYASDAGQAVLDQMGLSFSKKGDEVPAALKEFYATPLGASVKAKETRLNEQMQKTLRPWAQGVMQQMASAAREYAKAQGAPAGPGVPASTAARATTP